MVSDRTKPKYDAILVPGGGIDPQTKRVPLWVKERLYRAADGYKAGESQIIIVSEGFNSDVGLVGARVMKDYLIKKGINGADVLTEEMAWNTIGNAYFSRVVHTDPRGIRHLLIANNEFHMPRTIGVFEWVLGDDYRLEFGAVPNEGIRSEDLEKRIWMEKEFIKFYATVLYPNIKRGDLHAISSFMFNPNDPFNQEYKEFCDDLGERAQKREGNSLY